ncbi:helix-turn-helix domain-containing protein [Pseudomonas gingeri]|uniref:AraC-like ligand-binding domain-containing protein n=1 Tax=Pseudomonas gingeri TaxID=117681 RepID=UPI0015A16A18|nr:helix-turn-helix domain-containing protein [Pseudomonas gingeri]NVZ63030.1 helix-turn-helix domain-containing protein [Pseudomonas gingeri]NVZ78957.1 helix-turn-helix domain-containing protein [Pseudomonas gingeri]
MTPSSQFNTVGTLREKLDQWSNLIWDVVGRLDTQVIGDGPFEASAMFGHAGTLQYCRLDATPHRVERGQAMISRDDRDLVKLVVQQRGRAIFAQGDREVCLEPGQWALYDTRRPYSVTNLTQVRQLVMLVPRSELGLRHGAVGALTARGFGRCAGVERMLPTYLARLFSEIDEVEHSSRAELGTIATHLLRMALLESGHKSVTSSSREILRLQVHDFVQQNLMNPQLNVELIASRFRCSKRNLHKAFSDDESTLAQFIWQSRLERVRDAFGDGRLASRSVTEIAYQWGFNNAAHFSKAFKARFGLTPTRYRADVLSSIAVPDVSNATH